MFEELRREIEKIGGSRKISIPIRLDDKGYLDRMCPNDECDGTFKVLFEDGNDKIRDEEMFCPFCRHSAASTEWSTPEQVAYFKEYATAEMAKLVQGALQRGVAKSRPMRSTGGLLSVSMSLKYSPGRIPQVVPIDATQVLRQEFSCESCGCRYASLGASFFCPACGHNSATSAFDTTLTTVEKTVTSLGPLQKALEVNVSPDDATNAVRQILEDQFPRIVGAFERLNETLFDKLANSTQHPHKGAVFQRLDDASMLWQQASGIGYGAFLSNQELSRLKLLFQRRHVLSHRQGIVDQQYIDRSGDTAYSVGQRLVTRESDVIELVRLVRQLVIGLRTIVP